MAAVVALVAAVLLLPRVLSRSRPLAPRPPAPAPRADSAGTPARATLWVSADVLCRVSVDGREIGPMVPGGLVGAVVTAGKEHEVFALAEDGREWLQKVPPSSEGGTIVRVGLAPLTPAPADRERPGTVPTPPAVSGRAEPRGDPRPPPGATAPTPSPAVRAQSPLAGQEATSERAMRPAPPETVERGGLIWTVQDNGTGVDWHQARAYCAQCELQGHRDWRLPTVDELEGLYAPGRTSATGIAGMGAHVAAPFVLASPWVWSGTPKGSAAAWLFNFATGQRDQGALGYRGHIHALCVRRSGE